MTMAARIEPTGAEGPFTGPLKLPTFVPPREAILTLAQLAAWLQVGEDVAAHMNFKAVRIGRRWRWIAGQVLDELERRAE